MFYICLLSGLCDKQLFFWQLCDIWIFPERTENSMEWKHWLRFLKELFSRHENSNVASNCYLLLDSSQKNRHFLTTLHSSSIVISCLKDHKVMTKRRPIQEIISINKILISFEATLSLIARIYHAIFIGCMGEGLCMMSSHWFYMEQTGM